MRNPLLILVLCLPQMSEGADWKRVQDRGYSIMEVDTQSISPSGALKQADIREVFAEPAQMSSGKAYNIRVMHLLIKCAEKTSALQKVTYFLNGTLVHTLIVPPERMEYFPIGGNAKLSKMVCAENKS